MGVNGGAIKNLVRGTDWAMWSPSLWVASNGEKRLSLHYVVSVFATMGLWHHSPLGQTQAPTRGKEDQRALEESASLLFTSNRAALLFAVSCISD